MCPRGERDLHRAEPHRAETEDRDAVARLWLCLLDGVTNPIIAPVSTSSRL
jgi:hypothetical protein